MLYSIRLSNGSYHQCGGCAVSHISDATKYRDKQEAINVTVMNNIDGSVVHNNTDFSPVKVNK